MNGAGPAVLGRVPGYGLAQAYRELRHAMDDALRGLDLTTPQWGALAYLEGMEGCSGAEMARVYHVTPQTMNTIIQNLEHDGLIVREPHPAHGTVLRVRLTDEGRQRLTEGTSRVEAVQERMVSDLTEDERDLLRNLLGRCAASLRADRQSTLQPPCPDGGM